MLKRLICWWFGCDPEYKALAYGDAAPCKRCGADDTSYEDQAGITRHAAAIDWCRYWLFRRWWPVACGECGKRFGDHGGCLPF